MSRLREIKTLKNLVKQNEQVPISDADILKICDNKVNILAYEDLGKLYKAGKSLLSQFSEDKNNCIILLYQLRGPSGIGHWVSLIYRPEHNVIEFCNPYAYRPDQEINLMEHQEAYLTKLLLGTNCRIMSNHYKYQEFVQSSSTCGRHAAVRCVFHDLTNEEYYKFLSSYQPNMKARDFDKLVTVMTLVTLKYNVSHE